MVKFYGYELETFYADKDYGVAGVTADKSVVITLESVKPCGDETLNDLIVVNADCEIPDWEESEEDIFIEWVDKLKMNI